jgi:hypothetical protein
MAEEEQPIQRPALSPGYDENGHVRYRVGSAAWARHWEWRHGEDARWRAEVIAYGDAHPSEHRDGFIMGYLQAYADTEEYGTSVEQARFAYGLLLARGRRNEAPKDVGVE